MIHIAYIKGKLNYLTHRYQIFNILIYQKDFKYDTENLKVSIKISIQIILRIIF